MPSYQEIVQSADLRIELPGGILLPFQKIPAGKFRMGARGYDTDEEPVTEVIIPNDFYMGNFPVTQEQFSVWTETEEGKGNYKDWLAEHKDKLEEGDRGKHENSFKGNPLHPAEQLSWWEAEGFCDWLNEQDLLPVGYHANLPCEAEWEYACRAGTETDYYAGDGETVLAEAGWYDGNAEGMTHTVGKKKANDFQLYDMLGNVMEWCADKWHDKIYMERISGSKACSVNNAPKQEAAEWWGRVADIFGKLAAEDQVVLNADEMKWFIWFLENVAKGNVGDPGWKHLVHVMENFRQPKGSWPDQERELAKNVENMYMRNIRSASETGDQAYRVLRGGSWYDSAGFCRAAYRIRFRPGDRNRFVGFRVGLFSGPDETGTERVPGGWEARDERTMPEEASGVCADAKLPDAGEGGKR